jgi:hypothetical protein
MEQVSMWKNLQLLTYSELETIEAGAYWVAPWTGILIAVSVAAFTNLPDIVNGFADGWSARG